jgi:hypothetical protein
MARYFRARLPGDVPWRVDDSAKTQAHGRLRRILRMSQGEPRAAGRVTVVEDTVRCYVYQHVLPVEPPGLPSSNMTAAKLCFHDAGAALIVHEATAHARAGRP